jgi:hypothetical protein
VERGRTKKASLYVFDGRERTRTSCFASVHCVDRFPALKQQFLLYIYIYIYIMTDYIVFFFFFDIST